MFIGQTLYMDPNFRIQMPTQTPTQFLVDAFDRLDFMFKFDVKICFEYLSLYYYFFEDMPVTSSSLVHRSPSGSQA